MASNVVNITNQQPTGPLADGGGPPHDGDMEQRVARIEATLEHLATKADVHGLRADFEKGQKENRTWMIATVIALFLGCLAIGNFLASGLRSAAIPQPQQAAPLIIQVPAAPAPTPAPSPPIQSQH